MSNSSFNCLTSFPSYNATIVSAISQCQAAAITPFCWPPNNLRICVPTTGLDFYWPTDYYNDTNHSDLDIRLNSTRIYSLVGVQNNGSRTWKFDQYVYSWGADTIPGIENERVAKIVMRQRNPSNKTDVVEVAGPTVTLVKTAEFPTPTPYLPRVSGTTSYTSPTSRPSNDDEPAISRGAIAGIIIAGVAIIVIISCFCCCAGCCCGAKKKEKPTISDAEQAQMVSTGGYLMAQSGVQQQQDKSAGVGGNEVLLGPSGRDETLPPSYSEIDPRTPHSVHELPSSYRPYGQAVS